MTTRIVRATSAGSSTGCHRRSKNVADRPYEGSRQATGSRKYRRHRTWLTGCRERVAGSGASVSQERLLFLDLVGHRVFSRKRDFNSCRSEKADSCIVRRNRRNPFLPLSISPLTAGPGPLLPLGDLAPTSTRVGLDKSAPRGALLGERGPSIRCRLLRSGRSGRAAGAAATGRDRGRTRTRARRRPAPPC